MAKRENNGWYTVKPRYSCGSPAMVLERLNAQRGNRMMTREEWLNRLVDKLRPVFAEIGHPLPERLRASCGWPSKGGLSKKKRVVGQCWYPPCSADETTEVFVSPYQSDGYIVAETIAHELTHAAVGQGHGHKGLFIRAAKALGFTKPWRNTPATPELTERLRGLCDAIGPYPHATLDSTSTEAGGGDKPGGTRLLKAECQECGYTVRVTKKWLESKGAPICPCNMKAMTADGFDGIGEAGEGVRDAA